MIENFEGVGDRISSQMKKLKIKQVDICKDTEISKNAISNYVNGNRIPDTLSSYKLSKALKVSMEWLLTGEDSSAPSSENLESTTESLSEIEQELIQEFRQLTDRDKKEVTTFVKFKRNLEKGRAALPSSTLNNGENDTGEEAATSEIA
ncbi:helix-turn-helix domain-containing protein [Ruminiclostridium papyrosolvens]|uniref:HTH cro/C1-type domain-containing protein n=1 Tax=Ruminiclostridium papyrosolvens C7 TaxID=1330534 RepID=U4QWR9_9FIRM|nr:helix-turn-helix domain-containing protein [Ruminiclostridium papyrosolvens]EPR07789.1 hypothetical protein L323_20025 [Ruminiclostridium papyrosolvens C7]